MFVVSEDGERYPFAPDKFEKLLCALTCSGWVQIGAIILQAGGRVEVSLHGSCINGEQDRAGVWQANEHDLVTGNVAARFDEFDSWHQFDIPINESVSKAGMVPVWARQGKA